MTDEIKTETTATEQKPTEPIIKKYPGRPKKTKTEQKQASTPVKKASIKIGVKVTDQWSVENKDPRLRYIWARKNDDREMSMCAQRGYVPATGQERILRNPFEAVKDEEGKTKERGDRILMCCPQEMVNIREKERLKRHINAKQAAQNDARRMTKEGGGFSVTADASEETSFNAAPAA